MVLDIADVQIRLIGKEKVWEEDRFFNFLSKKGNCPSTLSLRVYKTRNEPVPSQPFLNNQVDVYSKKRESVHRKVGF